MTVLSVEAQSSMGWDRYSHFHVSVDRFGASANLEDIALEFGFNADDVSKRGLDVIDRFPTGKAPLIPLYY